MDDNVYVDNLIILSNKFQVVKEVLLNLIEKEDLPDLGDDSNLDEIINIRMNKLTTEDPAND